MPTIDEFLPVRTLDIETRIQAIEGWASLFSGRQSVDPSAVESATAVVSGGGSGGGGPTNLVGDASGAPTANTVGKLRGKLLTGTETSGYVYAYDGTQFVAQNFVSGRWGVGLSSSPSFKLQIDDSPYTCWFDGQNSNLKSGSRGWHISKQKTTAFPSVWTFHSDGAPCWDIGMDFDTNNAFNAGFGNADLVLANDYSANAGAGADLLRISAEEMDSVAGSASAKFIASHVAGSPRAFTSFFTIEAGDTLTGLRVSCSNSASGRAMIALIQRAANNFGTISFNNAWRIISDNGKANVVSMAIRDDIAGAIRLYMDGSGRFGIGPSTAPTAFLMLPAGVAAASGSPLKFQTGVSLTTPENGSWEYDGTDFFATPSVATRRKVVTAPVSPSAYTPSNVTTDRSYDADATTLDEVADVLGTLLADLQERKIIG